MELKVWVDGVVRVVCGLSLTTSCQDVVIALAQAIGQTGRYILILKLRGTERQLVADDCPLQHLAQLGQLGAEVQFVLRRTGPSLSDGPDTPSRERHLPLPRPSEPEPLKRKEPQKALTFSLGPSTFPRRTKPNRAWSPLVPAGELEELERRLRQNEAELMHRENWEEQLQEEMDREQGTCSNLFMFSTFFVEDHSYQIKDLRARSAHLEQDLKLIARRNSTREGPRQPDEALEPLKQELHHRRQQGEELDAALTETQRELRAAEEKLQDRYQMIEELNKELRQCNLQQFIQQTGSPHADQTNSLPFTDVYLSNAGIME
uniref:Ras association domain family member 7b n=1 Tax=Dicentrarchus labrax TaxID=13489 RepID=A0A8C4H366_DICLA